MKIKGFFFSSKIVDLTVLLLVLFFLLSFFEPKYLFSKTITTGGDTGSHYYTAVYLKDVLLPQGKIMGWMQGNYAGFPLFYHYFPLPFVLMVFISHILPMQIAFKLISVLGIFLLPLCVYFSFRLLKYAFPIPTMGALFTLPFLFMEANSMWGANIPSTLAGEFSYGIGISLSFLLFGTLYSGIQEKNKHLFNALLIFLIILSHGYALIFSGLIGSYFLLTRKSFCANLKYLLGVYGLGTMLSGFWLLPFIGTLPYVTEYVTAWHIKSIFEIIPRILVPGAILTITALFFNLFDRRTWYFLYLTFASLILYFLGPRVGVLDIRFIPILQILLAIFGATLPLIFLAEIKAKRLLAFIAFLLIVLWTVFNLTYIKSWIAWNYSGVEGKTAWPLYQQISAYLRQSPGGRVVYEHSPLNNVFGTERAFESLPFFANRNTLEGLYMQSSPSSPFIFYIQSEISKICSGPFPNYSYSGLNPSAAIPHLKMFNVTQYIVRTPEAKKFASAVPELKLEKTFGDYAIYRILGADGRYVSPLTNQPIRLKTNNWKRDFFEWFRRPNLLDVPLVYDFNNSPHLSVGNYKLIVANDLLNPTIVGNLPKEKISLPKPEIHERLKKEEISFDTNLIGYPHLIKVSYHPNWKVEGAEKIYLVSPSFMLVYPTQKHVRLYFGKTIFNYAGEFLSFCGLILLLVSAIIKFRHAKIITSHSSL